MIQKITPSLWFADEAEEAARFYTSLFPNSHVDRITSSPAETPSGPAGSVVIVEFTLAGQQFTAVSAGPLDPFNRAVSLVVNCKDQAEVDRYWEALVEGGNPEQGGWIKDSYGVYWQIVPTILQEMIADRDGEKARRAMEAMLGMVKIDIAGLQRAFDGASSDSVTA